MIDKIKRLLLGRNVSRERTIFWLLIAEVVIFSIMAPIFLNSYNLMTILRNSVDLAVIAVGMTLVMVMGGIDVSVGSILGVVAILTGRMIQAGLHPLVVIPTSIGIGMVIGYVNGFIITKGSVPPIIATLGTMNIWRATIFGLLGGRWITGLPPVLGFVNQTFLFVPVSVLIVICLYAGFWYVTKHRRFGRAIYAIGNSLEATRLAGINVGRVTRFSYALVGGLTGIAAMTYIARLGGVEVTIGNEIALQAIAAVVIGGTSVTGGRGSVIGTLLGVLFINVMQNGVLLLGIPSLWERAVIGLLLIGSVAFDLLSRHRNKQTVEV